MVCPKRILVFAKYANVSAADYQPQEMPDFMLLLPISQALNAGFQLGFFEIILFMDGLVFALAWMFTLAKWRSDKYKDYLDPFRNFLLFIGMMQTLVYVLMATGLFRCDSWDDFTGLNQLIADCTAEGEQYGANYGAIDGQNYYCTTLNYKGHCPAPKAAFQLLQAYSPTKELMSTRQEMIMFLMGISLPIVLSPPCSAIISGLKKSLEQPCQSLRRNRFFSSPPPSVEPSRQRDEEELPSDSLYHALNPEDSAVHLNA